MLILAQIRCEQSCCRCTTDSYAGQLLMFAAEAAAKHATDASLTASVKG